MKIIALAQAYNEELYIQRGFDWLLPLVDQVVISEGRLTPFGNLPTNSQDLTREVIVLNEQKNRGKIKFVDAQPGDPNDREKAEGNNKNNLLAHADLEDGDIIYIWDIDEFFDPNAFMEIWNIFYTHDKINHIRSEEYQFAYNTKHYFEASHGRFFRYKKGAKFTTTNHFIVDGADLSRKADMVTSRKQHPFFHMCWVKHPRLIREKVLSFNRPSFTSWFNHVYLQYPMHGDRAYENNKMIPPYFGTGFCEGQHNKLKVFDGDFPEVLKDLDVDYTNYIKKNYVDLLIK